MLRLLIICLLLSFLLGYLEWGTRSAFLFQIEFDLLFSGKTAASDFLHPAILLPFAGQLLLILAVFQKRPSRSLIMIGIALQALFILLILFIGLMAGNIRMILSALPFVTIGGFLIARRKLL